MLPCYFQRIFGQFEIDRLVHSILYLADDVAVQFGKNFQNTWFTENVRCQFSRAWFLQTV